MEGLGRRLKNMSAAVNDRVLPDAQLLNTRWLKTRSIKCSSPLFFERTMKIRLPMYVNLGLLLFGLLQLTLDTLQLFWERLRDYLLAAVRDEPRMTTYTHHERLKLHIQGDGLYQHTHLRINYTSYDVRRAQDSLSLRTLRCDVMVAASGDDATLHPFWYAQVLGIYHAMVSLQTDGQVGKPKRVDLLWVWWFQIDQPRRQRRDRLEKVAFVPLDDDGAFGFIHPSEVIRACHLVPAFAEGRDLSTVGHSHFQDVEGDYKHFYVMK